MPVLLDERHTFPNRSLFDSLGPDGLVAIGGDLHPARLVEAYRSGLFPWSVNPITWWSPAPRAVFPFPGFHVSRSLKRRIRQETFTLTLDRAFTQVMRACAHRRDDETWISDDFIEAYTELHRLGHAHSIEAWHQKRLVGGVYGVSIGGFFAGESMFHHETDASKVALFGLYQSLEKAGFQLFDIQMLTPVTEQLGAIEIPRTQYLDRLEAAVNLPCQFPKSPTL